MPRNSSGVYTLPAGNPVSSGTLIEASWANTTLSDLASAMTGSLSRSGEGGMTAALRIADGTSSAPGLAFTNETSSGLYRAGSGDVRLSISGGTVAQFLASGVSITGTLSASGNTSVGGTLSVTGATTFTGAFTANGGITTTTLAASGNATVGGTLGVTGALTASGGVTGAVTSSNATITGGSINGTPVGATTASTGGFTNLAYTGNLTGGTGVVNLGGGQFVKDASGNVGIGTSSPPSYGTRRVVALDGSGGSVFDFNVASTRTATIVAETNDLQVGTTGASPFRFLTNGTERARIDSSGNLLVGTTGFNSARMAVSTAGVNNGICSENLNTAATNHTLFWGKANGVDRFYVLGNGNVQNTNNSYGALSDAKLKENIVDATPKLGKLNQVRVVTYNLKTDPDQKLLGVIAQELEQVFPGMVEETPDRDAEGNDLGTTTKSVKYSVFVPMLIKAIQEQQAIIESLTARIAALEAPSDAA